jgi:hypothetical protein
MTKKLLQYIIYFSNTYFCGNVLRIFSNFIQEVKNYVLPYISMSLCKTADCGATQFSLYIKTT